MTAEQNATSSRLVFNMCRCCVSEQRHGHFSVDGREVDYPIHSIMEGYELLRQLMPVCGWLFLQQDRKCALRSLWRSSMPIPCFWPHRYAVGLRVAIVKVSGTLWLSTPLAIVEEAEPRRCDIV